MILTKLSTEKLALKSALVIGILIVAILSLPIIFTLMVKYDQAKPQPAAITPFPVSVNPEDKTITVNVQTEQYLQSPNSPLEANVSGAGEIFGHIVQTLAIEISKIPLYQSIADVSGVGGEFVTITPGMRKEQVAETFGKALSWTSAQKKEFLTADVTDGLPLDEGSFFPATYFVDNDMSPEDVQNLVNTRFTDNVLAHYATSTASVVPLDEALTIASIIQRETIDNSDMRLISGIIWNRLFNGMDLQVDATLQYAKANLAATTVWWPPVVPKDKYIKSPYNTYLNAGLPPTPIADPSVAAILAALNPIKTTCLYYFNDKEGNFHCSDTYAEHVALLKQYY